MATFIFHNLFHRSRATSKYLSSFANSVFYWNYPISYYKIFFLIYRFSNLLWIRETLWVSAFCSLFSPKQMTVMCHCSEESNRITQFSISHCFQDMYFHMFSGIISTIIYYWVCSLHTQMHTHEHVYENSISLRFIYLGFHVIYFNTLVLTWYYETLHFPFKLSSLCICNSFIFWILHDFVFYSIFCYYY